MDLVPGKKCFEFRVELGGERFVVGYNERRTLDLLDDVCHGKGLSRPCHPEKHLMRDPCFDPRCQAFYGIILITFGAKFTFQYEPVHGFILISALGCCQKKTFSRRFRCREEHPQPCLPHPSL